VSTQEAQSSGAPEDALGEQEPSGRQQQGASGGPQQGASGGPQQGASGGPQPGAPGPQGASSQPTEEELRAAYEAELSRITSADMVLQATVSLLNLGARRLGLVGGPEGAAGQHSPERDLEQVRDAIDAVRGLMPVIERRAPQEARPLREALSQLQMAFAREAQPVAPAQAPDGGQVPPAGQAAPAGAPGGGRAQGSPAGQPPAGQPAPGDPAGKPGPAESSGRLWVPGR
jgi:hypothetical protein